MKHIFIINPKAGQGVHLPQLEKEIHRAASEIGVTSPVIHITQAPQDAKEFTVRFCEEHPEEELRFYACGGDGTLNEVLNGMIAHPKAELACYPCGTGNDFIANFGEQKHYMDLKNLMQSKAITCDCMKVGNDSSYRWCINVCNVGFDANVAADMSFFKRLPLIQGTMAYYLSIFSCLLKKINTPLTVTLDNEKVLTEKFMLIAVGNGKCYGGGFLALPKASVSDGAMDFCAVRKLSRFQITKLVSQYKKGEHVDSPEFSSIVVYGNCKKIDISAKAPVNISCDGEITKGAHLWIEIVPNALRFVPPVQKE